jgi:hypothetical protein
MTTSIPQSRKRRITATMAAREALEKGWYGVPASRRIDAQSAQLILNVAEQLSPEHRERLDGMHVRQAAALCWRLYAKASA